MLCKVGTVRDIASLPISLPKNVYEELLRCTLVLDMEYGANRDFMESGGYSLIVENAEDMQKAKDIIDFDYHYPEWVDRHGSYLAALYLMNDDYSIVLFSPLTVAPKAILDDMEDVD